MNSPAFVLTVAFAHTPLRKPSIFGRSVANRISVTQSRRAYLPIFACVPSDQQSEEQSEAVEGTASPEEPVSTTSEAQTEIQNTTSETEKESASVEDVSQESVVEEVVAQMENPNDENEEEASAQETKAAGQKKRRRRSRKREVTLPLEQMTVGMELEGTVKSVTDYGAFVGDMGTPTDGLLHVSQLAAGFVANVTDVVNVGDKLKVRVFSIDEEKGNFSLTRKTAEELEAGSQPKGSRKEASREAANAKREELNRRWDEFTFDPAVFVDAKVMSVTDFGGFCQLVDENGETLASCPTDGLIHISELSQDRVSKVSDILTEGQIVKVRVMSTDRKRNRISMSLRPVEATKADEKENGSAFAANMANAEKNQPTFKTAFELAFETARATANQN